MQSTSGVTPIAAAQSQTSTLTYLTLADQGKQAINIAQNYLNSRDYEGALRSLEMAKNNFKDALAQNRVFAFGEQQDIQAHLARTYLVSGDILCNLSRFEEACVSYEDALKYGALEAQQKLASLQNPSREREEVVIQIANGLGGQMIDGSGNTSYLHFNPTDKDLQLYAEVQKQQTSLEQVLAVLPQVRAGKGGRTVVQFASGVANIPTSGQNNKITTIWGVNNTSETIPGPNPMNLG